MAICEEHRLEQRARLAARVSHQGRADEMSAVTIIALWGLLAIAAAVTAGVLAAARNRDHSWWAAWCFVVPPMLIILLFLPTNTGPKPRRPSMDEEDREDYRGLV